MMHNSVHLVPSVSCFIHIYIYRLKSCWPSSAGFLSQLLHFVFEHHSWPCFLRMTDLLADTRCCFLTSGGSMVTVVRWCQSFIQLRKQNHTQAVMGFCWEISYLAAAARWIMFLLTVTVTMAVMLWSLRVLVALLSAHAAQAHTSSRGISG